tara:strand:+ start:259 stop:1200 length:942 start_codon:yes stop_codon:yes gene_type:complete
MTDKQFRYELRLLGLRGHNENALRLIVDGLSRKLPVRQISQSTGVTEKTITKMRSKAGAIAEVLSRRDGNATSDVNEENYAIYESDLEKHIGINRRRGGIQNSRYDVYGERRLQIMEALESRVPREKWNVQYLKKIGFKENIAIAMISEHDSIELYRTRAEQTFPSPYIQDREYEKRVAMGILTPSIQQREALPPVIKLAMFTSFNRYVELFYTVLFQEIVHESDEIPPEYIRTALQIIIKGLYDDQLAVRTGEAIIRFSVWRPSQIYKEGFINSLRPWKSTKQQLDRYIAVIDNMIKNNKMYLEKLNGDVFY